MLFRSEVLDTLARIYIKRKDYPKAVEALRQAISRATNPVPLQFALAQVHASSGDNASAVAELQSIVDRGKSNPMFPQARRMLADLRKR